MSEDKRQLRAEPPESNLAYHFATDEDFRVSVCEQAFARLSDSPEHPWEVGPWLEAGYEGDCGQIADMPQKGGDCVRAGRETSAISENLGKSRDSEIDTREKLKSDVRATVAGWRYLPAMTVDSIAADVLALLNMQAAITERETIDNWDMTVLARIAEQDRRIVEYVEELGKLRDRERELVKALEAMRARQAIPEGVEWPRFEDGACVEFGDEFMWNDEVHTVDKFEFQRGFTGVCGQAHFAEAPVKRPPVLASDGEPIEVGETLYGLSDGKAWTISGVNLGGNHPVEGCTPDGDGVDIVKHLRPEWLSHEQPDSARRIISDHTRDVCDVIESLGIAIPEEFAIANFSYIERIEKLARENG